MNGQSIGIRVDKEAIRFKIIKVQRPHRARFISHSMIPVLLLLVSVIMLRIAPAVAGNEAVKAMAGWSPLMAMALCGAAFYPRRWALAAGLAAVVIPHVIINGLGGFPVWDANLPLLVVSVLFVSALGARVGPKASIGAFLGASLVSTVLFHLVSNTVSFFTIPGYTPGVAGWIQAQTTGLPQYSPQTWVFSAKQLAGDLLFTLVFVMACRPARPPEPAAMAARA